MTQLPNGKAICYAFNSQKGCRKGSGCRFEHACGKRGGGGHSYFECTK